nr:GTP-binding protein [Nocardia higoensis]
MPLDSAPPGDLDRRTPVLVLTSPPGRAEAVVRRLAATLERAQGTLVVRYDLRELREGVVRRTLTSAGRDDHVVLELAHCCLSCTLRADLLPLLCTLAARDSVRRIVLALDPAFEAEAICGAVVDTVVTGVHGRVDGPAGRSVRIEAVLACLDGEHWMVDALGDETVAERGLAVVGDDDRTVAQLAVGAAQVADAVLVAEPPMDPLARGRMAAVLDRLAPTAPVVWLDGYGRAGDGADGHGAAGAGDIGPVDSGAVDVDAADLGTLVGDLCARIPGDARRGRVFDAHAPLLRGQPPLTAEHGVTIVEFSARRPFHPVRLHEALDVLLDGVICARGRVWLATQPEEVVWLESAGGGLRVGGAGAWLAAMSAADYAAAEPDRRAMAAIGWDERFGDRHVEVVVLACGADPGEIRAALHWALVDDDELRTVQSAPERVARWADPFGEWHADPCVDMDEGIEDVFRGTALGSNGWTGETQ